MLVRVRTAAAADSAQEQPHHEEDKSGGASAGARSAAAAQAGARATGSRRSAGRRHHTHSLTHTHHTLIPTPIPPKIINYFPSLGTTYTHTLTLGSTHIHTHTHTDTHTKAHTQVHPSHQQFSFPVTVPSDCPEEWEPEDPKFGYDPDRQGDPWAEYCYLKQDERFEH